MLGIVKIPGLEAATSTESAVESGSLTRTLLALSFAGVGALMLPTAIKRLDRAGWRLLSLLGAYFAWAAFSFTWTVSPQLTIRRLVLAALVMLGAFGLGAGYYGRSERGRAILARDLLIAGTIAAASAWIPVLAGGGGADILAGDWELVPVALGTEIGYPALLASLICIYGRHTSAIPHPFASRRTLGSIFLALVATIISLRKRTLLAVTVPAMALFSFLFHRRRSRVVLLAQTAVGVALVSIVMVLLGVGVEDTVAPIFLRGEQELDLGSLTGRVPLWEELVVRASDRPWTGVGYGAFWTPRILAEIETAVLWPAVTAHNGYIDEVLATGLPGLGLLLGAMIFALVALAKRATKSKDAFALLTAVWICCYIFLNLTESLMQNPLRFPFYSIFMLAFASFSTRSSNHKLSAETDR